MKVFRTCLLGAIMLLSLPSVGRAGDPTRVGTAGAPELLIPVGARGVALGDAYVSGITGIEAIFWNPAGLAQNSGGVDVLFSHMNYIADIGVNYVGIGTRIGTLGNFALTLKSLSFGDITQTTDQFPDGGIGTYSPSYVTMGLTYAKGLTDRIYVGASVKYVSEKIMRETATGVAFDAGIQYKTDVGLKFGIAVRNIGSSMQFAGDDMSYLATVPGSNPNAPQTPLYVEASSFDMPSTFDIGASYDLVMNDENKVTVIATFRNDNYGTDKYMGALEYNFDETVFLRGGWIFATSVNGSGLVSDGDDNIFGPTAGIGIQTSLGGSQLNIDYAYRATQFFVGNNIFSVRLGI